MAGTGFRRHGSLREDLRRYAGSAKRSVAQAGHCKLPTLGTDGCRLYGIRPCEFFILQFQLRMDSLHNLPPDMLMIALVRLSAVIIIPGPDCRGIIRRIACEPQVIRGIGSGIRSGLARDRHIIIAESQVGSCSPGQRVHHCARQQIGGGRLHCCSLLRLRIIQQNIAVMIHNLGIQHRLDIHAAVRNRGIRGSQFHIGNAVRQTSKRKCGSNIRVDLAVLGSALHQMLKTKLLQIIKSELRADLDQRLNRHNILGTVNRPPHAGQSLINSSLPVRNLLIGIRIIILRVILNGGKRLASRIQRRKKACKHLEGRTRLAQRAGRAVQSAVAGLFSASADQCHYMTG